MLLILTTTAVTTITALSMSAISTNGVIKGGSFKLQLLNTELLSKNKFFFLKKIFKKSKIKTESSVNFREIKPKYWFQETNKAKSVQMKIGVYF